LRPVTELLVGIPNTINQIINILVGSERNMNC